MLSVHCRLPGMGWPPRRGELRGRMPLSVTPTSPLRDRGAPGAFVTAIHVLHIQDVARSCNAPASVTGMRTCGLCAEPITEPGVPADVYRYETRRRQGDRTVRTELVCRDCADDHRLHYSGGHDEKTTIAVHDGNREISDLSEHSCEVCGYRVLLVPDDRRTRFFCTPECRLRAGRVSEGRAAVVVVECGGCGSALCPARSG